jgi:fructokinase
MEPPFVVVGESLVDVVVPLRGEPSQAAGGSPMNVAVGLARLGVPTVLITQVGDDEHGRCISEHVRASGARLADVSVLPGRTTSTSTARLDADNAASYEFDLTWDLAHHTLPDHVLGLHVGSIAAALLPGRLTVVDMVRQAQADDTFVSYDPNVRPAFVTDRDQAWRDVAELAASSRLVKVSDEDLEALRPGCSVEESTAELLSGAAELVIVTHGASGSSAYSEASAVHVRAPSVEVVDTVGAGDSFMAATLAILLEWNLPQNGPGAIAALDDDHVEELLGGAMAAAAVTCSRRGADPPTRSDLPATWPAV